MSKDESIAKAYHDPEDGYGSILRTYKDAKQYNNELTIDDVKSWFSRKVGRKIQLKGYNSFVVSAPYVEYQLDLFFFNDLDKEAGERQPSAMLAVDIFSKYCAVVPINSKQPDDVLNGIKEILKMMQAKPDTVMTDEEGSFVSNKVQQYFRTEDIRHLITRAHPAFAERTIRTIKSMVYKRVEGTDNPKWMDHIQNVLQTYNNKMVHSATGFTPNHARLAKYREQIHFNLLKISKRNRKYPPIEVGNKIRIYKKKDKMDKERQGVWSKDTYTVQEIIESDGQKLYKTSARDRPFLRSEILAVEN